jgi:hypothetical protein
MPCGRLRVVLLALLSLSISGGLVCASVLQKEARSQLAEPGESLVDAFDAEAKLLPLCFDTAPAVLWAGEHCHEVIPDCGDESCERLVLDDHAARGPPTA